MHRPTTTNRVRCRRRLAAAACGRPAHAEMSAEELAKLAQNPVGNLISVPFQNNTNLNFGPEKGTQNILNIQPVIPISVNNGLEHHHAHDRAGDLDAGARSGHRAHQRHRRHVFTAFLSPAKPGQLDLGRRAGRADCRPTAARNSATGTGAWARRSWCCISTTATPGSTARWSTTSGRSPATSRAAPTTTA